MGGRRRVNAQLLTCCGSAYSAAFSDVINSSTYCCWCRRIQMKIRRRSYAAKPITFIDPFWRLMESIDHPYWNMPDIPPAPEEWMDGRGRKKWPMGTLRRRRELRVCVICSIIHSTVLESLFFSFVVALPTSIGKLPPSGVCNISTQLIVDIGSSLRTLQLRGCLSSCKSDRMSL